MLIAKTSNEKYPNTIQQDHYHGFYLMPGMKQNWRLSYYETGFKAQGEIIRDIKGLFNMMTQLNLEEVVHDQIQYCKRFAAHDFQLFDSHFETLKPIVREIGPI